MVYELRPLREKLENAFDFGQRQVRNLVETYPDFFPTYTVEGRWKHECEIWTHWCEGFLGGMMWTFFLRTGSAEWRAKAEHYSRLMEHRQSDTYMHDLGFLFWPTWKCWYNQTNDPKINQVVVTAGQTMGLRFQEKGGYLRSFVAKESLFIDIMMNVGIVFYAAQQTGDEALLRKANQHCQTTARYLVRGDGGTAHEGFFDPESGEFLRQSTHQGWRSDSTWARGLAWALYGFGTAYKMTRNREYLATACRCAGYYLARTDFTPDAPGGAGIPPNDYDDPRHPQIYESSAAAVAAAGLLNLSEMVQDPIYSDRYAQAALIILDTLAGPTYLAQETPGHEGILMHGIYHLPRAMGVDESVMWGEYFFIEALHTALGPDHCQHISRFRTLYS